MYTRKLKHANSMEYFEHLSQMSSKSNLIISSYTVSKLTRFLRHSVGLDILYKVSEQIASENDENEITVFDTVV